MNKLWLLAFVLVLAACKKEKNTGTRAEKLFEQNILNRIFVVDRAKDNGQLITDQYSGYVFVLLKEDYYHGPLKAVAGNTNYTGSWSTNDDFSKLTIRLPAERSEFRFLSRDWRFTKKGLPVMKLAPWGSAEPLELHMRRK